MDHPSVARRLSSEIKSQTDAARRTVRDNMETYPQIARSVKVMPEEPV